jgi:hypothetical protein
MSCRPVVTARWTTRARRRPRLINGDSGASFTIPVPRNYILGLKYDTKSLSGTKAPVPADITFNFATSLGGSTGGSLLLKKQETLQVELNERAGHRRPSSFGPPNARDGAFYRNLVFCR